MPLAVIVYFRAGDIVDVDLLVQYWWYLSQAMAAMKWMLARAVMKPWKP